MPSISLPASPQAPLPPEAAASEDSASSSKKNDAAEGIVSRVWRGLFGGRDGDYERRLQFLAKEEASVRRRVARRARTARGAARNVLGFAAALEVVAVSFAIMTTKSQDMSWQSRAVRLLPMFLVPALAAFIYSAFNSVVKLLDQRDQTTLENLRAERQAKIDELKERTNYYLTQQLIQRYDLDPAAKAAAASVLASKLGAETGLKVYMGDESGNPLHRTADVPIAQSVGLRHRKPAAQRGSISAGGSPLSFTAEDPFDEFGDGSETPNAQNQRIVDSNIGGNDGGWLARLAALLVGEDPTQCYALICQSCHMHNGLARKEDFSFITYYCPHCNALNGQQQAEGQLEAASTSSKEVPTSLLDSRNASPSAINESPLETLVASTLATVDEQHDETEEVDGATEPDGSETR